jgi:hypothetical protein
MLYKKNYKEAISRLNDLYTGNGLDKIYARMCIPNPYLEKFKEENTDGESAYPDIEDRISFWDKVLSVYSDVEDDSIPSCYLSEFDQGLYGGLAGGEVRFIKDAASGWITSMTVPFLKELDDFEEIKFDEENEWFRRYRVQLEAFKTAARGKFGISHFILISGMNFLFELRGATAAYYDILEDPEKAKKVIDFSIGLNVWVWEYFFKTMGLYDGGTCSNMCQWLPGRIVSESVDPFHLTSVQTFEEWGRDCTQKIFDSFDGGVIHLHSNGHHLIESVCKLKGLKCIYLIDEESATPIHMQLDTLSARRGTVPYSLFIPYRTFASKLEKRELHTNILYNVEGVPDAATANRLMAEVKEYRA